MNVVYCYHLSWWNKQCVSIKRCYCSPLFLSYFLFKIYILYFCKSLLHPPMCMNICQFALRLLLPCVAGGYPPNVLQPTAAYCTNPALDSPFISRGAPHQTTWEASVSERRNYGREMSDQIYPTIATSTVIVGFFYMPQSCDMGQTALLPLQRKSCWGFFRLKNPTALNGFEPAKLGTRGQHAFTLHLLKSFDIRCM
jgi:hypothetical protein